MLTTILESLKLNEIEIILYDTTDTMEEYLGKYPKPSQIEYEQIVSNSILQNTKIYETIKKRIINVGSREWTIICGVTSQHIKSQRSDLPYIIVATSLLISCFYNIVRIILGKCLQKTQSKTNSNKLRLSIKKVKVIESEKQQFDNLQQIQT